METSIQPSFIPKKALAQAGPSPRKQPVNFFSLIAKVIFAIVVLIAIIIFAVEFFVGKSVDDKKNKLQGELNSNFDPALVKDLTRMDSRIESVKSLLATHTAYSAFFTALGNATLKTVRFTNFTLNAHDPKKVTVSMTGTAPHLLPPEQIRGQDIG